MNRYFKIFKIVQQSAFWGSIFCFVLFLIEMFYLRQNAYSFRGVYTEKIILEICLILGILSFERKFFIGLLSVVILSMIPMFIPFIMLLTFTFESPEYLFFEKGKRLEVISVFGQGVSDLAFYEQQNFILEKKIIQFGMDYCEIEKINQIDSATLEGAVLTIITKGVEKNHVTLLDLENKIMRVDTFKMSYQLQEGTNRLQRIDSNEIKE